MIEVNASKGLGDAIYLRVIAQHWISKGERVCVFTSWPAVFSGIDVTLNPLAELRHRWPDRQAFYCLFCRIKAVREMDQFSMACAQAGIDEPIPLTLEWSPKNAALIDRVRRAAGGRKVLIYQPPKVANNDDQAELRPRADAFLRHLDSFAEYFRVKVGASAYVQRLPQAPFDMDLFDATTVSDVLDVCTVGDMAYSDDSYLRIAFEAMDKPFTTMYARAGLMSKNPRVRNITPARVINKWNLATVLFDD